MPKKDLTPGAQQTLTTAENEARSLRQMSVGSDHLLLGLLVDKEEIAGRVLAEYGVTHQAVYDEILGLTGRRRTASPLEMPYTPGARKVFEIASELAGQFGHPLVGTAHLLLALLDTTGPGSGTRILLDHLGAAQQSPQAVSVRAAAMYSRTVQLLLAS